MPCGNLTDHERIKLLSNPDNTVATGWLSLYGEILSDRSIPSALKAYFLRIDEQPMDRAYAAWYRELVAAREKLMLAVNRRYKGLTAEIVRWPGYLHNLEAAIRQRGTGKSQTS